MSVVEALEGDWKQTSSENFGIFLKAIGKKNIPTY